MYFKKWSTSLATNATQIQFPLIFYLTPVRTAKIKNTNDNKWRRDVGNGDPLFTAKVQNDNSPMQISVELFNS